MVEKSKLDEDKERKAVDSVTLSWLGLQKALKCAFADADHAGCQDTRRSTSGSIQLLGDRLISGLYTLRLLDAACKKGGYAGYSNPMISQNRRDHPGISTRSCFGLGRMDTPTLVSKYLNGMEDILDDGDSMEARKLTVEISKEELELFEALDHKSVIIVNKGSNRVVVFKKAPPRAYIRPFTRFSLPCDVDSQVIGYANEDEPSVLFGRDFLVTSKSRVDFGIGEMHIDLTMLEEMKEIDATLDSLVENLEEAGSSNGDLFKMGKASRNKNHKEVLDRKYKELEEHKPILEVLENYMTYQKKLDEVLMGKARLNSDDYGKEVKMRIVEHGLPKKMCDPGNFVLSVKVNGTIEMNTLADMGASVSVLPYCLFMNLGLGDPKPYNSNLTMADNTQAKAMGEVKNVRIQIGYQAYLVDFLILDIPVDKELPLLLGCPFLRTCGAIIDMRRDTLCIDDGVIRHTYFPKPRAKAYLDNFAQEEDNDWLSCFEVGSLPVQSKNTDEGNEGYGTYKKIEGDGDWHAIFEVTTPSERKFTRMFKTKKTNRKLSKKFISEDILKFDQFLD
ncbi:putative ribonuclease H-like domain-containing protein [Tanacetum coccineum]